MASQISTQSANTNDLGGSGGITSPDAIFSPSAVAGTTTALAGLAPASIAMDLLGAALAELAIEGVRELLSPPPATEQDKPLYSGPALNTELAAVSAPAAFIPSGNILGYRAAA
jgi:hypothetical protein